MSKRIAVADHNKQQTAYYRRSVLKQIDYINKISTPLLFTKKIVVNYKLSISCYYQIKPLQRKRGYYDCSRKK